MVSRRQARRPVLKTVKLVVTDPSDSDPESGRLRFARIVRSNVANNAAGDTRRSGHLVGAAQDAAPLAQVRQGRRDCRFSTQGEGDLIVPGPASRNAGEGSSHACFWTTGQTRAR